MTTQVKGRVRFGLFEADLSSGTLSKRGIPIHVQEKPFQILQILLQRRGELVTRDELRKQLWPADTFVEFDEGLNTAIGKLRNALGDSAERPAFVETVRGKGYRFIASISDYGNASVADEQLASGAKGEDVRDTRTGPEARSQRLLLPVAIVVVAAALSLGVLLQRSLQSAVPLTEKDTILIADFTNSTGDPVFDDSLREALTTELQQSPFLSVVSDQTVRETLRLMHHAPTDRITAVIGNDLCQRVGSKALVQGSIARLGSEYIIGLNAVACGPGDSLARVKVQSASKEGVLKALDSAAAQLRRKLGESIASIQRFDTRIEQATTTSLEALRAYSIGRKTLTVDNAAAVPWFQQAIRLDPNFAMAYASLGTAYSNLNEISLAIEATKKAYELRQYTSERETWYIESHYYGIVLRDLERTRQIYEVWQHMYPRDFFSYHNLTDIYDFFGQYDRSLAAEREALRVDPLNGFGVSGLLLHYLNLNRLAEARTIAEAARKQNMESAIKGAPLYLLAFLSGDEPGMAGQLSWGKDNPGNEDLMLSFQSDTDAYFGRLKQSRELSHEAVGSALRASEKETAATWQVSSALREAELGDPDRARTEATRALSIYPGVDVRALAALAFARVGDVVKAQQLLSELGSARSEDTVLNSYWLPLIRASIELRRQNAAQAIEILRATAPCELGISAPSNYSATLYPVYLRGEAYLVLHRAKEAEAEFQKFLDHRGAVKNSPLGALALLQLARAHAMAGNSVDAQNMYEGFFTLWKHADPGLRILKQAKAEYMKVK
jgi:DNA-binding winged helix-turn-helix (wHTH) protein/tetratricopeptide (TPR) repeat protein